MQSGFCANAIEMHNMNIEHRNVCIFEFQNCSKIEEMNKTENGRPKETDENAIHYC